MIAGLIYILHIIAAIYAFISRYRKGGISEGLIAVGFIVLIFSVGWTIATMLVNVIFEPKGLTEWFNRDTIALTLITLAEAVFYSLFFSRDRNRIEEGR